MAAPADMDEMFDFELDESQGTSPSSQRVRESHTESERAEAPLRRDDGWHSEREVFVSFLEKHTCVDMMPQSGKVVVLDSSLVLKNAFFAMLANDLKSAPLWSEDDSDWFGVITDLDFIEILLLFYENNSTVQSTTLQEALDKCSVAEWLGRPNAPERVSFFSMCVAPDDSLIDVSRTLKRHHLHRVMVHDSESNSCIFVMTHARLLKFLMLNLTEESSILKRSIQQLGIGTYDNLRSATYDTPLVDILKWLARGHISAVPIVDESGAVVDIFSNSDARLLSERRRFEHIDRPVHYHLQRYSRKPEDVRVCTRDNTLEQVMSKLVNGRVHRLVVVDSLSSRRLVGILSQGDVLNFLTG